MNKSEDSNAKTKSVRKDVDNEIHTESDVEDRVGAKIANGKDKNGIYEDDDKDINQVELMRKESLHGSRGEDGENSWFKYSCSKKSRGQAAKKGQFAEFKDPLHG